MLKNYLAMIFCAKFMTTLKSKIPPHAAPAVSVADYDRRNAKRQLADTVGTTLLSMLIMVLSALVFDPHS